MNIHTLIKAQRRTQNTIRKIKQRISKAALDEQPKLLSALHQAEMHARQISSFTEQIGELKENFDGCVSRIHNPAKWAMIRQEVE